MIASPTSGLPGPSVSGRYRILRKLGSGRIGTVYLVHDQRQGRRVALKILRTERLGRAGIEQFRREFQAFASLRHPQIAEAYDFGYTDVGHVPFYTREYIEGEPLVPGPPGPDDQSDPWSYLKPALDLLDALTYLHSQEILHLDVHAGNVIVSSMPKRGAVLIDFGLVAPSGSTGVDSRAFKTPAIFAPTAIEEARDIYSAGRLLLYRLTGRSDDDPRLPKEIPGWGARRTLDLERIVAKALEREPGRRFQSAAELRDALSKALGVKSHRTTPAEPSEVTVSRGRELAAIGKVLQSSLTGRSAALWLSGPTGIGKSRLLTEARWRAQILGLLVADVGFLEGASVEPALLKSLSLMLGRECRGQKWIAALAPSHGGSSEDRSRRAAKAYFAEQGPALVLLLDDFELADTQSRLLAEALLDEVMDRRAKGLVGRGLAIIAASKSGHRREESVLGQQDVFRTLKPLPRGSAEKLLRTLLRPLHVSKEVLRELAAEAAGAPLRVRQIARAVHAEPSLATLGTSRTSLARGILRRPVAAILELLHDDPEALEVLRILPHFFHPARVEDLAAVCRLRAPIVRQALRRLAAEDAVVQRLVGRSTGYQIASTDLRDSLLRRTPVESTRQAHLELARVLGGKPSLDVVARESLARHLLAADAPNAILGALEAAKLLRRKGLLHNTVRLLTECLGREENPERRLEIIETMSSIHEEAGDHREGVTLLEPVRLKTAGHLGPRESVRIARRLGVHYHRAGRVSDALRVFEEARRLSDETLDQEELIFIDSELAELHTLTANYDLAAEACQRGLELLTRPFGKGLSRRDARESVKRRSRLEVTLRASRGHLALRRMQLSRAKQELELAARLAGEQRMLPLRALILNNLGIAHNQLNELASARASFEEALKILEDSGERRSLIQIGCNLALIAAKTGKAVEAEKQMERVESLRASYPDLRLEFFSGQTRATVAYYLGDMAAAATAFEEVLPLGRKLRDRHLTHFGEIFLADAQLECGRLGDALRLLKSTVRAASRRGPDLLKRMAHSRLFAAEMLAGRERAAKSSRLALANVPRTSVSLLEAWNDLYTVQGQCGLGEPTDDLLSSVHAVFSAQGIPAGRGLSLVQAVESALERHDAGSVSRSLQDLEGFDWGGHKLLGVRGPLVKAEAFLFLSELDRCAASLDEAARSIVGQPFFALDLRIEQCRAALEHKLGNHEVARGHLHRALSTQELLAMSVPAKLRQAFLAHSRFRALKELAAKLQRNPTHASAGQGLDRASILGRIVGRSARIVTVVSTIERLADQELPVVISGETGTGKDLLARVIHDLSPRRSGPFEPLNCASIVPELFESELCGFEAGSFTGAEEAYEGLLSHSNGGTILLDDLTALSLECQAKLLRLLESRQLRRLGASRPVPFDVRFLATSKTDLLEEVRAGRFRDDLYYRFRGVEIVLPPLRSRREDISLLAEHFIAQHARRLGRSKPKLEIEALSLLEKHDWPGNVRELEAVLLRVLVTTTPEAVLAPEALQSVLPSTGPKPLFSEEQLSGHSLDALKLELERVYLSRLFREHAGDINATAAALGVKRVSLYIWLRRIGLDVHELRRKLRES